MKKRIIVGVFLSLVLSFAACKSESEKDTSTEIQQGTENVEVERPLDDKEDEEKETVVETPKEEVHRVKIYSVNEEDGSFTAVEKECNAVNEQEIWNLLKEEGVVRQESKLLSLAQENGKLHIDVDDVFGEHLRSLGTTGERELLGCVVNTYLEAYSCEEVKITEDGETLYSGHAEYSDYFTRFE